MVIILLGKKINSNTENGLKDCFNKTSFSIRNFWGQSYDNASPMTEKYNGVET